MLEQLSPKLFVSEETYATIEYLSYGEQKQIIGIQKAFKFSEELNIAVEKLNFAVD